MKNILRYLLLALVVIGFTVPVFGKAEAAKIAILPLANNVADNELSSQVFFNECMDYFKFPEFDMVDDAVLDKALKEENYAAVGKNGPDEAMLKRIMAKTGADMALMMSLDELSLEPQMGMIEDYYKFKIKARIMDNLEKIAGQDYDKNRFEQEMIYYIEKLDVNEEKNRLDNHLKYYISTMESGHGQGKKLGFIAQEMGREINTLGSKSNHAEMQKLVVQMKDELEQIKEQVLNVL